MYDFGYLKPISNIIDILGRLVLSLAILGSIFFFASGDYSIIAGILVLLGGGILGLLLILVAQLVNLFLQIEQNTRKRPD